MKYINKLTNGLDSDNSIFKSQLKNLDNILHEKYDNSAKKIADLFRRADAMIHSQHPDLNSEQEESSDDQQPLDRGNLVIGQFDYSLNGFTQLSKYPDWTNDTQNYKYFGEYELMFHNDIEDRKLYYDYTTSNGEIILKGDIGYDTGSNSQKIELIKIVESYSSSNSSNSIVSPGIINLLDPQGNSITSIIIYENPPLK